MGRTPGTEGARLTPPAGLICSLSRRVCVTSSRPFSSQQRGQAPAKACRKGTGQRGEEGGPRAAAAEQRHAAAAGGQRPPTLMAAGGCGRCLW